MEMVEKAPKIAFLRFLAEVNVKTSIQYKNVDNEKNQYFFAWSLFNITLKFQRKMRKINLFPYKKIQC